MKPLFAFLLFFLLCASISFAKVSPTSEIRFLGEKNTITCKNIIASQHILNKVSAMTIKAGGTGFIPFYFWMLTSHDCWQLCVVYQENDQFVVSSVDPPAGGGGYIGATQVCLDQNLNPGSPYNSFNNLC